MTSMRTYLFYSLSLFFSNALFAQSEYHNKIASKFAYARVQQGEEEMPYRYFVPASYDPAKKYPLVLTLHGSGESGSDNERQITRNYLAVVWADSVRQLVRPSFVLSPQAPVGEFEAFLKLADLIEGAMDTLIANYAVDTNRIYITGLSMGGNGTYDLLRRFPDKFAAAVPMSGSYVIFGGTEAYKQAVEEIIHIPVWYFHGRRDRASTLDRARRVTDTYDVLGTNVLYTECTPIECLGEVPDETIASHIQAQTDFLYTEIENGRHGIWEQVYNQTERMHEWLFSKVKRNDAALSVVDELVGTIITTNSELNWSTTDKVDSVRLWYSANEGKNWTPVKSFHSSENSHTWDVSSYDDGVYAQLRFVAEDTTGQTISVQTIKGFSVDSPGKNGSPAVKLLNYTGSNLRAFHLTTINLNYVIADVEEDLLTVNIYFKENESAEYKLKETFTKEATLADTLTSAFEVAQLPKTDDGSFMVEVVDGEHTVTARTNTIDLLNEITSTDQPTTGTGVSIYPNPVINSVVHVELPLRSSQTSIEIQDLWGRVIVTHPYPPGQNQLKVELPQLSPGIYFIHVSSGSFHLTRKIMYR